MAARRYVWTASPRGETEREISYLDTSPNGSVRPLHRAPPHSHVTVMQRPKTSVTLQDYDPPPTRPQTAHGPGPPQAQNGAHPVQTAGAHVQIDSNARADRLQTSQRMNRTAVESTAVVSELEFRRKALKSLQHSCAAELAKVEEDLEDFRKQTLTTQDLEVPGVVPVDDDEKNSCHEDLSLSQSAPAGHEGGTPEFGDLQEQGNGPDQPGKERQKRDRRRRKSCLVEHYLSAIMQARTRMMNEELQQGDRKDGSGQALWWKNRAHVEKEALKYCGWAAVFGVSGTFMAILQNEFVYQGYAIQGFEITTLKAFNSVFTLCCLACIYGNYRLKAFVFRVTRHCRSLVPLYTGAAWKDVLLHHPEFWFEFFLCGVHCPPFMTREVSTQTMENLVVYRIETLGALLNSIRIYLVWKYLRDRELLKIPQSHMISGFTGAHFGSVYVLKKLFRGWLGLRTMALLWILAIVVFSYWFRAAEITACSLETTVTDVCQLHEASNWQLYGLDLQVHKGFYIWDALWFMCVSTLTIGYGDMSPSTHYGRVCGAAIVTIGMLFGAMSTAALSHLLDWTPEELSALKILEREKARTLLRKLAQSKLDLTIRHFLHRYRRRRARTQQQAMSVTLSQQLIAFWKLHVREFVRNPIKYLEGARPSRERDEVTTKLRRLQQMLLKDNIGIMPDDFKVSKLNARTKHMLTAAVEISDAIKNVDTMRNAAEKLGRGQTAAPHEFTPHDLLKTLAPALRQNIIMKRVACEKAAECRRTLHERIGKLDKLEDLGKQDSIIPKELGVHDSTKDFALKLKRANTVLERQASLTEKRQKKIRAALKQEQHWWKDKDLISIATERAHLWAAILGSIGTLAAMSQHEYLIVGNITGEELNALKAINSLATILCILFIIRIYWLHFLLARVLDHVHNMKGLVTTLSMQRLFEDRSLWLEICFVSLHCPPYLEFCVGGNLMGNFVAYEIETIMASINCLRIYLVWRTVADWMLSDLPKRHTLAGFANLSLDSTFVIKRMLHSWKSMYYLMVVWIICLMFFAYLFRAAELSACLFPLVEGRSRPDGCKEENAKLWMHYGNEYHKVNDSSFQNACWQMFVTATTVGYGETIITTHFGRMMAMCSGITGMILIATTTACLCNLLEWNNTEMTANAVIERQSLRNKLHQLAVETIEDWWISMCKQRELAKDRGGSSGASVARFQAFASVKSLYNSASQKSFITSEQRVKKTQRAQLLKYIREDLSNDEIDGFQSIGDKVDVIAVNFGRIEDQLVSIQNVLWLNHDDHLISENRRNMKQDYQSIAEELSQMAIQNLHSTAYGNMTGGWHH